MLSDNVPLQSAAMATPSSSVKVEDGSTNVGNDSSAAGKLSWTVHGNV